MSINGRKVMVQSQAERIKLIRVKMAL